MKEISGSIRPRWTINHTTRWHEVPKLRLLHFKIEHNIYPSNILLNKMRIKETDLCEICGVTYFIEHIMSIHGTLLKGFWKKVFQLLTTISSSDSSMKPSNSKKKNYCS